MIPFLQAATPYLTFTAALAAAVMGLNVLYARVVGPLLGATVLKKTYDKLEAVESRLNAEFGNGVPYGSPGYVPMRAKFDAYVIKDEARWVAHDADAATVREQLGIEQRAVRARLEAGQE